MFKEMDSPSIHCPLMYNTVQREEGEEEEEEQDKEEEVSSI